MTLVIVWREGSVGPVWTVTDSRLTQRSGSGTSRLTDNAGKLLEIPARIIRQEIPGTSTILRATTFGFAYSGSTLVALQAYAAVLPLWSRLMAWQSAFPPLHDFAQHLGKFILAYGRSVGSAANQIPHCECFLLGPDQSNEVEGWSIKLIMSDSELTTRCRKLCLGPGEIEMMGSGANAASAALIRPKVWAREPLQMIRQQLRDEPLEDVGGGVQIGYLDATGFQITWDAQPIEIGKSATAMRYRGFDFGEICMVGNVPIALMGMS